MKQSAPLVTKYSSYGVEPFLRKKYTQYLQVLDLQSVHVQAYHITGSGEAVTRFNEVAELGLGEELLLCQGPAGMKPCW